MPDDISEGLRGFFEYVWQDTQGFVYLPTIHKGQQITKYMYEWPRQKNAVVKHVITQDALGNDVFYSPALFKSPKPEQDNVAGTHIFWTDFDGTAPKSWPDTAEKFGIPEPSLIIASSVEGREHAYWRLAGFESDVSQIESRNRALTYTLGADTSGWDANQFLRPPFTHNYGYNNRGEHKEWYSGVPLDVRIVRHSEDRSNPNVFNPLGSPEYIVSQRITLGDIPGITDVFMDRQWPTDFRELFNKSKDEAAAASPEGRSGSLSRLGYYGAENGFTDEQIYAVLLDADDRWEKYKGRHDREKRLVEIIARARAKHGYLTDEALTFDGLLKDPSNPIVTDSKLVYNFKEFSELEIHVDWMLEGLLRNEGIGMITGKPNVGKTQLAIQMGIHVALGWDLLGWKNVTSPKKVLVLSLEMGKIPLKIFWNSIVKQYPDNLEELAANFDVMPLGEGIAFESKAGQTLIENLLSEFKPDLLIIDSLQKVTSKELTDELAVKAMLEFNDKMRQKHHTAMVYVHHNRKKNSDSGTQDDLDDLYGSRYISANIEFALTMRAMTNTVVTVSEVKNRLSRIRDPFEISRNENLQYTLGTEDIVREGISAGARLIQGGTSVGATSGGMLGFN